MARNFNDFGKAKANTLGRNKGKIESNEYKLLMQEEMIQHIIYLKYSRKR